MSDVEEVRKVLAEVDWHRQRYDAADSIRRTIRLNNGGGQRLREVARFRWGSYTKHHQVPLSGTETAVIYEALGVVMERHRTEIKRLESTIGRSPGNQGEMR